MLVYPDVVAEYQYVDRWPDVAAKNRAYEVFRAISTLDPSQLAGCVGGREFDGARDLERGLWYLGFDELAQPFFVAWFTRLETRLRSDSLSPIMRARPCPSTAAYCRRWR